MSYQYVIRRSEEDLPECLNPTLKHGDGGGGGITVWVCFAGNGVGGLHKVAGNTDREHSIKILKFCALSSLQHQVQHQFGDRGAVFQQDKRSLSLC